MVSATFVEHPEWTDLDSPHKLPSWQSQRLKLAPVKMDFRQAYAERAQHLANAMYSQVFTFNPVLQGSSCTT